MKRLIALLVLCAASAVPSLADTHHASVVTVRNRHHVQHHRAHKARRHRQPKHRHNSI